MSEQGNIPAWRGRLARTCIATAVLAAAFCAVVAALGLYDWLQLRRGDYLNDPRLSQLRARIVADEPSRPSAPRDNAQPNLREEYRQLDHHLRAQYQVRVDRLQSGRLLLVGGAVLLAMTIGAAKLARVAPPELQAQCPGVGTWRAWPGIVAIVAVAFVLAHVTFVVGQRTDAPRVWEATHKAANTAPPALEKGPAWPMFRGPGGLGLPQDLAAAGKLPLTFDGAKKHNVLWQVPAPQGSNSPIIWGSRLFLTGSLNNTHAVYCFAVADGKLLWQRPVDSGAPKPPDFTEPSAPEAGYAAPTAATDGRRVYALFANGDLAAVDFAGKLAWVKNLGYPINSYGHATSLVAYDEMVLVQYDTGYVDDHKSALYAFDGRTGRQLWKRSRDVEASWTTPIVIRVDGKDQLVTSANPWAIGYELPSGKELWRAKTLGGEVAPSPAYSGGMVIVAQANSKMAAVRPEGRGDVSDQIVWTARDGLPDTVSLLGYNGLVLLAEANGLLTCYDAAAGEKLWEHAIETTFTPSPIFAGGRVYHFDRQGQCLVLDGGREYKELGKGHLGEGVLATPAVAGSRMYVRGERNLFCVGVP